MSSMSRRGMLKTLGGVAAATAATQLVPNAASGAPTGSGSDSLAMQLYKSLNDDQRRKICLPIDHPRRQYVSNWWYIHRDYRIPNTFNGEQQQLIQQIFDSLHSPEHQEAINQQVQIDQYGQEKNAPAVGFFGTPDDENFEFIYTGHHVTRRCNAHSDQGQGFGGAPIFYGHFRDEFHEGKDHPGNPYWYQGKVFNKFVECLDGKQQQAALISGRPRSERPDAVIKKRKSDWAGLSCETLNSEQRELFLETIENMLAMFRPADVKATLKTIQSKDMIDQLHVSWYDGKYDLGSDQYWDTWQIEGPEMVWYFRGEPHIHCYFHLKG